MAKQTRKINARELVADVRSGMDDAALMAKYAFSARQLETSMKRLVEIGALKEAELAARTNPNIDGQEPKAMRDGPAAYGPEPEEPSSIPAEKQRSRFLGPAILSTTALLIILLTLILGPLREIRWIRPFRVELPYELSQLWLWMTGFVPFVAAAAMFLWAGVGAVGLLVGRRLQLVKIAIVLGNVLLVCFSAFFLLSGWNPFENEFSLTHFWEPAVMGSFVLGVVCPVAVVLLFGLYRFVSADKRPTTLKEAPKQVADPNAQASGPRPSRRISPRSILPAAIIAFSALLVMFRLVIPDYLPTREDKTLALMNAAVCGDTAQVKSILKGSLFSGGLNADVKDIAGFTALIYACSAGNLDTVRILLDHGAKTDSSDLSGETALTTACRRNHTAVIKLLLEKGANVQATALPNGGGERCGPLSLAARNGSVEVVKLLLENGATLNARCFRSAGYFGPIEDAAFGGNLEVMKLLVDRGGPGVECCQRALAIAAERGNMPAVDFLLEHAPNERLFTALEAAAGIGQVAVMKRLLSRGLPTSRGKSVALLAAAKRGRLEAVRLLMDNDVDMIDAGSRALCAASFQGGIDIVKLLLERGVDVGGFTKYEETYDSAVGTALTRAAANCQTKVAELLIAYGAEVNAAEWRRVPSSCESALSLATRCRETDLARLLLNHGADARFVTHTHEKSPEIKALLAEYGAKSSDPGQDKGAPSSRLSPIVGSSDFGPIIEGPISVR